MFCAEIVKAVQSYLDDLFEGHRAFRFFRSQNRPVISTLAGLGSDLSLWVKGVSIVEDEKGSFTVKRDGCFFSFRTPQKICMEFALVALQMESDRKIELYDKIHHFLFEHRVVPPVIPASVRRHPELFIRMQKLKAEIQTESETKDYQDYAFYFPFSYVGPYHSGEMVQKGTLVTQKSVNLKQDQERRWS